MHLTVVPGPYVYGNIYKVWCPRCRSTKKISDPKTLHLPECPDCSFKCYLKAPHYSKYEWSLTLRMIEI